MHDWCTITITRYTNYIHCFVHIAIAMPMYIYIYTHLHRTCFAQAEEAREKKAISRRPPTPQPPQDEAAVDAAVAAINQAAAIPAGGGTETDAALNEIFDGPPNTQAVAAAVSTQVRLSCVNSPACHP